ncbi:flagellar basal body rod protein FlgB [Thalassobacillus sp. CUG 92003]|uniref:flagellar basal body rod protein FlgB n=1 Tax=Thalassobacillus sp. CUG 92003 TaxID=2736641 RepID=UPI0015E7C39C|nr:flagellar basal body rod protein FlgB [Thalassobacillus sp. CUG 92003]
MNLFSDTFSTLENALNYTTEKNRVISNNIANVDTPGYKAKEVAFKDVLHNELQSSGGNKRTDARHYSFDDQPGQSFTTRTKQGTTYNHNGNNVDIDKEMNELAKNQIQYQALVERLNGKFQSLESVIRGGQ